MLKVVRPTLVILAVFSLLIAGLAMAQGKSENVKREPVQQTTASSGKEMFNSYCAVCHGKDGKGTGPAATQIKQQPPDLTTLAKRHGGKYPDDYVLSVLRFGVKSPTHGSSDMPMWGPLLSSVSNRDNSIVQLRISNLNSYIRSFQAQ